MIKGGLKAYQAYVQLEQKAKEAEGAASLLAEASQQAKEALIEFESAKNSAAARRIADDIGIIRRAISFNR